MSDHLPIEAKISVYKVIDANSLLIRSKDLGPTIPQQNLKMKTHRYTFDELLASDYLRNTSEAILEICLSTNDPDEIVGVL